jgi:streptogrisin D
VTTLCVTLLTALVAVTGAGLVRVAGATSVRASLIHKSGTLRRHVAANHSEGTVTGLIRTSVCAEPGDSGGPLFAASAAIGVASGGTGDRTTGRTTSCASA